MKISYVSDIHLEFGYGNLTLPGGDVLLLAGDIVPAKYLMRPDSKGYLNFKRFVTEETSKYVFVYMVMGNHEHYNGVISESRDIFEKFLTKDHAIHNVKILENESVQLKDDLWLIGSTLWTDYNNADSSTMDNARICMNDHLLIQEKRGKAYSRFHPTTAFDMNEEARGALRDAIHYHPEMKFVVMTHHTPSFKCGHERWGGKENLLNYAFHNTNLDSFIQDHPNILHWICGHTHDSFEGYIGQCAVHINPRGYINERIGSVENMAFNANLHFEV